MVAVGLVMACGLAMMIMARSLILSLESTRAAYYEREPIRRRLLRSQARAEFAAQTSRRNSRVAAVETRVVGAACAGYAGPGEPADGTIALDSRRSPAAAQPAFSCAPDGCPKRAAAKRSSSARPSPRRTDSSPATRSTRSSTAREQRLNIVGIVLSPEYVFEARPGETLPDNKRFGVFWMNERELANAFDLDGAFNNVVVDVAPGGDAAARDGRARPHPRALRRAGRLRPARPSIGHAARR